MKKRGNVVEANMFTRAGISIFILLILSSSVAAQNCGGMPAVNGVCIPPDSPTSPLNSTYGRQPSKLQQPLPRRWRPTWGAIAMDDTNGGVGTIAGARSKRAATREAISRCRNVGGGGCKISLVYHNQCAVLAWASENGVAVGGVAIAQSAETVDIASDLARSACSEIRGGGECKIVYSECARPIFMN